MKLVKLALIAILGMTVALTSCEKSDVTASSNDTSLTSDLNDFLFLATTGDSTAVPPQGPGGPGKGHPGGGPGGKGGMMGGPKCSLTKIEVSALPSAITNYISTNYTGSTIENAAQDSVKNYIVLVKKADNSKVGVLFDANGAFVKELPKPAKPTDVAVADLPAAITSYVSTTYAGSTIEHAMKNPDNGNYMVVVKKSDGTHVGLGFDATGKFISELTLHKKG